MQQQRPESDDSSGQSLARRGRTATAQATAAVCAGFSARDRFIATLVLTPELFRANNMTRVATLLFDDSQVLQRSILKIMLNLDRLVESQDGYDVIVNLPARDTILYASDAEPARTPRELKMIVKAAIREVVKAKIVVECNELVYLAQEDGMSATQLLSRFKQAHHRTSAVCDELIKEYKAND